MASVEQELWNVFTHYTLHGNPLDPEHMRVSGADTGTNLSRERIRLRAGLWPGGRRSLFPSAPAHGVPTTGGGARPAKRGSGCILEAGGTHHWGHASGGAVRPVPVGQACALRVPF